MAQTLDQEIRVPLIKTTTKGYADEITSILVRLTTIKNSCIAIKAETLLDADGFPGGNPTFNSLDESETISNDMITAV